MFSGFMTNAWLAGTVVALVAGVVGLFVVMRGGAFAAHAIPNGAFAGAAAAYWLGTNELLGLGIAAGASALAIGSLGQRNRRDVATALVLVLLLASGALFLSLSGGYEPEVYGLLFGEILGVSSTQLLPSRSSASGASSSSPWPGARCCSRPSSPTSPRRAASACG